MRRFDRKIKKRFLTTYFFFFFSWEKKTDVKVHYENSWLWKKSVKQKCRSWNFGITMWTQKDFVNIQKVIFFLKEGWKNFFFRKPKNPSKKKTSANFRINEVNCGKIQDQFVISVLKTGITNWSQIWCLCLTILELLKTQHCAV